MAIPRLILYRDAALADASGPSLQQGISVLVAGHRILAIRPTSNEGILHPDARIVDAGGSTIVPGMVDAHSHVTLPGGSHWIDRGFDAPALLLEVAEHNGDLLLHAGGRGDGPRARGLRDRALRVPCGSPRGHRRRSRLAGARLRARFRRGRGDGPPEDVPRQHAGDLPLVGLLLLDHDDPSIRQRRREGAHRATTGASG